MKIHHSILFVFFLLLFVGCAKEKTTQPATVILVSFDGFRHDYVDLHDAKNLKRLIAQGASAKGLSPSFPSKTFPNHYSIVTGLRPWNHGIIANSFWSESKQQYYSIGNASVVQDGSWYKGKPLWNLAEENGIKSASYFWVGSEADINGARPSYYKKYNGSIPYQQRVNTVKSWLKQSSAPRFISLYFSATDNAGHTYGPTAPETKAAVKQLDDIVGQLMEVQAKSTLPIHLIFVSDHGMAALDPNKGIQFPDSLLSTTSVAGDAFYLLYKQTETQLSAIEKWSSLEQNAPVTMLFPKDFPYLKNTKIQKDLPQAIVKIEAPYWFKKSRSTFSKGTHGFDPQTTPDMMGIIYASGPGIKKGYQHPRDIDNIHIYPLIATLLDLPFEESEIDGKYDSIQFLLENK